MKSILGLDLGNKNFRFVFGNQNNNSKPEILTAIETPSAGMSKGSVVDFEDFVQAIENGLNELKEIVGKIPKDICVNIAGPHITIKQSKGRIAVSRADGEISNFDIDQVIQKAQEINIGSNKVLFHVIPREYIVDDLDGIKDPLGMHGIILEVDCLLIGGFLPNVKTINKAFDELGYKVEEKIFKPLSSIRSAISKSKEEAGAILVDLGADTTNFAIFEEGKIISIGIVNIGMNHITQDIAICLKTSLEIAEKIKLHFGLALSKEIPKKEKINLTEIDSELEGEISKKYLAEIIEARLEEIFDAIKEEIKKANKNSRFPGGVVLVGGGAKMPHLNSFVKEYLKLPVKIGNPINILDSENFIIPERVAEIIDDPSYVSAVGLFLSSLDNQNSDSVKTTSSLLSKFKKIGKVLLP